MASIQQTLFSWQAVESSYDDGADKAALFDEDQIAPLIPARDLSDGRHEPLEPTVHDTIYVLPTGGLLQHPSVRSLFALCEHPALPVRQDWPVRRMTNPRLAHAWWG